ncbi:PA2169 family four-helix-bundle protein [Rhodocytophaga aerolata]|uniref:PA2169 family four-helix-bundle protein n=1 Tax=Rhodocytophaga aerolata TaxID=455078 RepID=A0ABT8R599_9BACT|nr:PA2169 family four-helix-bundle protein [Rhodocytophaga aerolata]MDO1447269.1 PA2169 family four-helix-bundle protein [Rhodocytophaga aerolata]
MTNQHEKAIATLNRLIEVCQDGDRGYKNAAEHIEHDEIKTVLYRLSQQRALFQAELKDEVRKLGGNPDESPAEEEGTILGNIHRAWINVKEKLTKNDFDAILEECKRGDKAASLAYEAALKENLPEYIKEILIGQHHLIKGAVTQLHDFQQHPDA